MVIIVQELMLIPTIIIHILVLAIVMAMDTTIHIIQVIILLTGTRLLITTVDGLMKIHGQTTTPADPLTTVGSATFFE